ncbi:MAG: GCN5-related N-acetyltransferase [Nocardioides sp.]|nr:GCN5-related N-acetyltransferase [Nocardioides sp.]
MVLSLQPVPGAPLDELTAHLVVRRFLGEQGGAARAREAADAMVGRIRERTTVYDVVDGVPAGPVGRLWTVQQGEDRSVLHLRLDDAGLAPEVRVLVEDVARAAGCGRLTAAIHPEDPVGQAFADDPGFETAAVQMRLDLTGDLPGEGAVVLEPMDQAAYAVWEADEIESYAEARAKSGESPEQALRVSREQHAELLPHGLATEHHAFFVGRVDGVQVGTLWVGTERPMAFVYDVIVDEAHRRQGHGGGLMRAGALWARERGSHALGLNVFGYNHGARALYEGLGYEVVELFVGKQL